MTELGGLIERLRADNDWLMQSRLVGHELRALEAGNNALEAAAEIATLRSELEDARRVRDDFRRLWGDAEIYLAAAKTRAAAAEAGAADSYPVKVPGRLRKAWCELTGGHDNSVGATWMSRDDRATHVSLTCSRCGKVTRWYAVPSRAAVKAEAGKP